MIPSGPGFATENNLRAFTTLLYSAQRRLSITSPYFVPDESLLYAITTAAQRGVDVELFVSEAGDQFMVYHAQRSYYEALLRAGVRIYFYPAPAILHSKFFSVDDDVAVLGSSNMDMRSFGLNYEVSLMLLGAEVVAEMRKVEDTYRAMSKELTLEDWLARPRAVGVHGQRDEADRRPAVTPSAARTGPAASAGRLHVVDQRLHRGAEGGHSGPAAATVSGVRAVFASSRLVLRAARLVSTASTCVENSDLASAFTSARSLSMSVSALWT